MGDVFCDGCEFYQLLTWPEKIEGEIKDYCIAPNNKINTYRRKGGRLQLKPSEKNQYNNCPCYSKRQEIVMVPVATKEPITKLLLDAVKWWR